MKLWYLLMCIPFLNCSAQRKLNIETILAETSRITQEDPETGKTIQRTTLSVVTNVLEPMIKLQSEENGELTFLLQGNISSGGHSINKVRRIRLEKEPQQGNSIKLKYNVEIKHIPGKEGANVRGYNYSQQETYHVPKGVQSVYVEMYEDRINKKAGSKQPDLKLVAEQVFEL